MIGEGRARFRRMKLSVDAANVTDGYKVLEYLYEIGPGSIEEIGEATGLSREQVVLQLQTYMSHGMVEELP
jgi:DNA-binding IclR family transcriptional regulator